MGDNISLCPEGVLRYQHTQHYLGQLSGDFSPETALSPSLKVVVRGWGGGIVDGADSQEAIETKINENGLWTLL